MIRGLDYPVGPDAPVYLWWTRLAAHDGLSVVARPGVPGAALVLAGTLHVPLTAVLAGLECVLGTGVGLAAAALVRARRVERAEPETLGDENGWIHRATWLVAGTLAGTFAVHLATGYLASLAFAALFVAAAVALAIATRRATAAATLLLAAAGLAHPLFLPLGLLILGITAALAWRTDRAEAVRVGAAAAGGGALAGAGILALLAGPGPLSAVTSRDGFLREAGLGDALRSAYLDRFVHRWTRYVQWASIPLAAYGLRKTDGFVRRFLAAWGITLAAGVAVGLVTGLFPADRFITFGYVVPILAGYGLVRLWRFLANPPVLAYAVAGALTVAMLAGALIAWARQEPFLSTLEVERATAAGRWAAAAPPRTPLVFFVNDEDDTATFLATRAANVIRAAMPPDRVRDVVVIVSPPVAGQPTEERLALTSITTEDSAALAAQADPPALFFLLKPFDAVDDPDAFSMTEVAPGVFVAVEAQDTNPLPSPEPGPIEPLGRSSSGGIAVATLALLALVTLAGYGWARAFVADLVIRLAIAPMCGIAALIITGIVLERVGLPLTGSVGPTLVSLVAGGGGYLALFLLQRHARPDAP